MEAIIDTIINRDFIGFQKLWNSQKNESTEYERQCLLLEILNLYRYNTKYDFFKKVFDEILKTKTSLDFSIDCWAPTFLSQVVNQCSKKLLMYFVDKGANINFVGDSFLFLNEKEREFEDEFSRYQTCLDFANLKFADKLSVDYNFSAPDIDIDEVRQQGDLLENVTISAAHYYDLLEQSIYFQDLIHLDRLREYLINSGAKTYEELKKKNNGNV